MKRCAPIAVFVVLSLAGVWLSATLLRMHVEGKSATGLLAEACGDGGGGCDEVIHSRWGVFPPAPAAADEGASGAPAGGLVGPPPPGAPAEAPASAGAPQEAGGVPVAALGLFYYTMLAAWFVAVGRPDARRRRLHAAVTIACALGCLGSVWFIIVMAAFIEHWCPLCLASHTVNFLLLASLVVLRPRAAAASAAAEAPVQAPAHPSWRLAATAVALGVAACAAQWQGYRALALEHTGSEVDEVRAELEDVMTQLAAVEGQLGEFQQDSEKLETMYFAEEKVDLGIEDHHPMIEDEKKPRMTLAFFSDIECPHCASYDKFIFEEIMPLFNGHLRLVYKHFPLQGQHPNAYKGATALEAAHLQGKFWEAHDYLLERRTRLASVNFTEMATELGIDPLRFITDMNSKRVRDRVDGDIKIAQQLRLTATPTVFLNDRLVKKLFRKQIGFWRTRAESLKRYCEEHNMPW